jgi:hypothetical protein
VDGTENQAGLITHRIDLSILIAGRKMTVRFLLTGLGRNRAILGLPWLIQENPDINWRDQTLQWRNDTLKTINYVAQVDNDLCWGGDSPNLTSNLSNSDFININVIENDDMNYENEYEIELSVAEYCADLESDFYNEYFINKVKPADHFNQIYRNDSNKGLLCFARDLAKLRNTNIFKVELQIAISQ